MTPLQSQLFAENQMPYPKQGGAPQLICCSFLLTTHPTANHIPPYSYERREAEDDISKLIGFLCHLDHAV